MDYIQGIAAQTEIFLYAFGFGFLLGVLYDVFRTVRMIISGSKGFVMFMDLLYFAAVTFLTFCFILAVDGGRIRFYVASGEIFGWLVYYFSFGAVAMRISNAITVFSKKLFKAVFRPVKRLAGVFAPKIGNSVKKSKKNIRKSNKKQKFILQKYISIVYNLLGYNNYPNFKKKGKD